jgi:hypothetical protein
MLDQAAAAEELVLVSKSLRLDAERAAALRSFFDIGQEPSSIAAMQVFSAHAAVLIRGAILEAIALAVSRMLDRGGSDKHTLEKARELAAVPGVKDQFSCEEAQSAFEKFDSILAQLQSMEIRNKIRAMRDFAIAHKIPTKFKAADRPLFDDLWVVYGMAIEAVEALGVATKTVDVSMKSVAEVWDSRNRFYWNQLIAGSAFHPKIEQ